MFALGSLTYLLVALGVIGGIIFIAVFAIVTHFKRKREARELEQERREWEEI